MVQYIRRPHTPGELNLPAINAAIVDVGVDPNAIIPLDELIVDHMADYEEAYYSVIAWNTESNGMFEESRIYSHGAIPEDSMRDPIDGEELRQFLDSMDRPAENFLYLSFDPNHMFVARITTIDELIDTMIEQSDAI